VRVVVDEVCITSPVGKISAAATVVTGAGVVVPVAVGGAFEAQPYEKMRRLRWWLQAETRSLRTN
jgi:hypothetical protein